VAGITSICKHATFDAEAAIAIESCANPAERSSYYADDMLNFAVSPVVFDPRPVLLQVSRETKAGVPAATIAARFQNTVVQAVGRVALGLCRRHETRVVALSGGSFQNRRLLAGVGDLLRRAGIGVAVNRSVPANDGGVALGQVAATGNSAVRGSRIA
jgi:hydrogenase maturation protein HypF